MRDLSAKAKKWNLLANHFDRTFIRTMLCLKIGYLFEMEDTAIFTPVELIFNVEFRRNYNLCDQIEYGKVRTNFVKLDTITNQEPEITWGYLL